MILQKNYMAGEPVDTIYFGGGTPSLLTATALSAIMETIYSTYTIADTAEITFEANPDDISEINLQLWKKSGINRLSIGVQSFFDEDLVWMNRAHTASQANDSIMRAQDAGFVNMSIDLIYGTPGLSDSRWADNMQHAAELLIPHLSCYALTVEPGTPLDSMTKKKKVQPVSNDAQARQFMIMTDFFQEKGYEHYEISNLSMPGKRSIHNSSYWSGSKYLGLGPSAHSFNGRSRQWNIANNVSYIQSLKNGSIPFEIEMLTETQRYNEYIMTSLRKMEGVDVGHIKNFFGSEYSEELIQASKKFIDKKWIDKDKADNLPGTLILTREGKLFADHIASALFG